MRESGGRVSYLVGAGLETTRSVWARTPDQNKDENLPAPHLALGPQKSGSTGDGLPTSKDVKRPRKSSPRIDNALITLWEDEAEKEG